MAETFERLGIQLELESEIKGNPTEVLANLKKSLEEIANVLKGIDLSKLGKAKVGDIGSDLKKTKDSAKDATAGLKEVASAVSNINNTLAAQSKFIQYTGRDFNEFFKTNKKQFLEMADGSDNIARKMASPFYQEMSKVRKEAEKLAKITMQPPTVNTTEKPTSKKLALADSTKQEEQNNRVRAEIIRTAQKLEDDYLAKQIKNSEAQAAVRRKIAEAQAKDDEAAAKKEEARLKRLQEISERRDVELSKLRGKASADQQSLGVKQSQALNINEQKTYQALPYMNKDADGAYKAYLKNLEDVKNQELKILTERGQQTLAILRNTATAEKAERENAIKGWRDYIAALSAQGYKAVEGGSGYVKKTAVADVGQAQTLAINEQISRTLDTLRAKSIDTKLTGDQLAATFRQNGIEISKLDDKQILAVQAGVRKLGFELKSTSGEFASIRREVITFGDIVRSMFTRLVEFYSIRTVLFAVSGQFREAVSASIKFSQNVADIGAISGATKVEMEGLGQSILTIARNSRFTSDEVAKLVQLLAQAGVAASDLPMVAESVGRFATATGSKPELASDLVTTSLNVFDKQAKDTAQITNVLTAALNESKLTTDGLATAFNYLAPQAEQLGMSLEQTAGIIATMAQAGIKHSTIGTGTSQLLKELAAPKGKLSDLLEYYNIKTEDVDPMKKSFAEIVATFQNATGKMGEEGVKVQHIMRALETRTARSLVTAISLGAESFERMTTSITGTNAAWVAYYKSMEGAEAKFNVIKQNFQSAIIGLFDTAAPALNLVASALVTLTGALNTTFGQIALGITAIGGLVTSFTALGAAVKTSTAAMAALTAIKNSWLITLVAANPVIAGIVLALGALGFAVAAYSNSTKDAEESAKDFNKELFKSMEAVDKSASGIRNAKEAMENGKEQYVLNEYEKAVKKYGDTSAQVNDIKKKGVKVTDDTLISLNKLKAQYPDYFADLKIEGDKVYGLIEAYEKLNNSRKIKDQEAKDKFNTEFAPELKKRAQALAQANNLDEENYGLFAGAKRREVAKKQKAYDDYLREVQPTIDSLRSKYAVKNEVVSAGVSTVGIVSGFGDELKPEKKPEDTVKPIPSAYNRNGGTENQYNSSKVILENLRLEREEILTRVKTIYQTADELEAAFKRIEQIDKEYAQASGEKAEQDVIANAKNIIKKEGQAKYEEYLKNAQEVDNKKLAQLKAKQVKERQEIEKLQQQHELEIVRIEQDAQKKANEARIANLTKQITSAYTGDADRASFVAQALGLTEANIDAEIDKQIAELTEKQRQAAERLDYTGVGRYQNQINNINYDTRSGMKTEASKALNQQAVQGIQAAEEKALQLEQQKLAVVEKQIAARKDSAWGADAVNALDIERLEAAKKAAQEERRIVLEKQAQIPAGELTNELADKYKTKLDGIAEKEKEITREIEKRNQGALGNFVDGMQEAWNRISDVNAAAKELGSNLTNTFVNGLGTTLSNTFSTAFFPDQGKVNELQTKINELRTQKADLEANIGTIERNTDKTPEEIKNLNDYKTKLDEVNNALRQQEEAVRKQKDAWSTFAEGLKGIMKTILQELQNYIAKLLVVWAVQKLVGFMGGMFSSSPAVVDNASPIGQALAEQFPNASQVTNLDFTKFPMATGGLVKGYAEGGLVNGISGGLIPETMGVKGKDSVPILAMPEEYIIPASVVKTWGSGHFEKYRNGTFKKMAEGGLVGSGTAGPTTEKSSNSKDLTLQIINIADPSSIPPQPVDAQQVINIVSFNANAKKEMYRVIKNAVAN